MWSCTLPYPYRRSIGYANCLYSRFSITELFNVGVRGNVLSWFRSYLTCRHHRTVIDGCESSLLPISSGVPQGSILGQLLFIIYIKTAPKAIHSSTTVQLYTDDIKCFRIIDNSMLRRSGHLTPNKRLLHLSVYKDVQLNLFWKLTYVVLRDLLNWNFYL